MYAKMVKKILKKTLLAMSLMGFLPCFMVESDKRERADHEKKSRHRHHHSSKRKTYKFSRFIKKHRSAIFNVIVIALALTAVIVMGGMGEKKRGTTVYVPSQKTEVTASVSNSSSVQIEIPFFAKEVHLVSNPVVTYMRSDLPVSATDFFQTHKNSGVRLDSGLPVVLDFDVIGLPVEYTVVASTIEVSETADLQSPRLYNLKSSERSVKIYHLKADTQYYYRVSITLSNSMVTSVEGSFKTAHFPRILSINGAVNVRDVGGWKTVDGKTVRQGLLYRGSELDGAVEEAYCITEKGQNDMLAILGICTDMDLRWSSDNVRGTHALGANVAHIYYGAPMYSDVFASPDTVRTIFSDLADADKYPIYMHCTYGMDRTGTFCYLLGALLGVDEEDLMRDYQLSALYYSEINSDAMNAFVTQLRLVEGETMQDKVENFLLSVGVTEDEIANIRSIFLG